MSNTERIIKELRPIADKLGEGAERVYELAVRQAIARGIGYLIVAVVLAAAVVVCIKAARWCRAGFTEAKANKDRYDYGAGDGYMFGGCAAVVGAIGSGIASLSFIYSAVLIFVNPQWAGIQEIMRSLP